MIGTTHMAVGIALCAEITQPQTAEQCFAAIIGGAIGGTIPDIDLEKPTDIFTEEPPKLISYFSSVKTIRFAWIIAAIVLYADWILKVGICEHIIADDIKILIIGLIGFIIVVLKGRYSVHRTFTHSFLGLILFSISLAFIYTPLVPYFAIGLFSHIILDLFTKKPVQILYPFPKGICFNICKANDRFANSLLSVLGIIGVVFFLVQPFL